MNYKRSVKTTQAALYNAALDAIRYAGSADRADILKDIGGWLEYYAEYICQGTVLQWALGRCSYTERRWVMQTTTRNLTRVFL